MAKKLYNINKFCLTLTYCFFLTNNFNIINNYKLTMFQVLLLYNLNVVTQFLLNLKNG